MIAYLTILSCARTSEDVAGACDSLKTTEDILY